MATGHTSLTRADPKQIWAWLDQVPDPEIPVISIVELGIVRAVSWDADRLQVTITPTYSGCPATSMISLDICSALAAKGVQNVDIIIVRAPAWTTDWITDEAKVKLKAYGIAPPAHGADCSGMMARGHVQCPQCDSSNTERVSQFGSTPCKASYRCKSCLEPFDYFKPF